MLVVNVVVCVLVVIVLTVGALEVLIILVTLAVGMPNGQRKMVTKPAVIKLCVEETCCLVCAAIVEMDRLFIRETNVSACIVLTVDIPRVLIGEANELAMYRESY